jgi:hypothetical protein
MPPLQQYLQNKTSGSIYQISLTLQDLKSSIQLKRINLPIEVFPVYHNDTLIAHLQVKPQIQTLQQGAVKCHTERATLLSLVASPASTAAEEYREHPPIDDNLFLGLKFVYRLTPQTSLIDVKLECLEINLLLKSQPENSKYIAKWVKLAAPLDDQYWLIEYRNICIYLKLQETFNYDDWATFELQFNCYSSRPVAVQREPEFSGINIRKSCITTYKLPNGNVKYSFEPTQSFSHMKLCKKLGLNRDTFEYHVSFIVAPSDTPPESVLYYFQFFNPHTRKYYRNVVGTANFDYYTCRSPTTGEFPLHFSIETNVSQQQNYKWEQELISDSAPLAYTVISLFFFINNLLYTATIKPSN